MVKRLTLTEDHLKLIAAIKFDEFDMGKSVVTTVYENGAKETVTKEVEAGRTRYAWGVDQWNLFGGSDVIGDVAMIVGEWDNRIVGSENLPLGTRFPDEIENYLWDLYQYIWENLVYIESLVHYFCNKGGLTPGTYKCIDTKLNWVRED